MPEVQLSCDEVLGSREICFNNRQESMYPHLMRFCLDFKFRVLQLITAREPPANRHFVLVDAGYSGDPQAAITPACANLERLEEYVRQRQVDILHNYLFGGPGQQAG